MPEPTVGGGQGQGKLATFFNTRVEFTSGEKNVSKLAQGLNAIGNAFLAPTRYLMEGRTITCRTEGSKVSRVGQSVIFTDLREGSSTKKQGVAQTALRVLAKTGAGLFSIIGVPVGGLIKGLAMLSPELRKRCDQAAQAIGRMKKDKTPLTENRDVAMTFIRQRDAEKLTNFLYHLWSQEQLSPLIEKLCEDEPPFDYRFLEQCLEKLKLKLPPEPLPKDHPGYRPGIDSDLALVREQSPSEP